MKKTIFSLSAALLLSGTLVGCGTNNGAVGNGNNADGVRPIGYYNGNGRGMNNNGNNGFFGYNNPNNNPNNNIRHYNNRLNNNGTVGHNATGPSGPMAYNGNPKFRRQAQTIANRVADMKNVENVSVVVTNNDVLIGVKTNDKNTKAFKSGIRKTAQTVVQGKQIHVATNPRMYNRIRNVHNNLQDGSTMNEVSSDITGIINDLGNAAKRPFQNNAR